MMNIYGVANVIDNIDNIKNGDILMNGYYKIFIKKSSREYNKNQLIIPVFGGITEYISSSLHKGMIKLNPELAKDIMHAQAQLRAVGNLTKKNCRIGIEYYLSRDILFMIDKALEESINTKKVVEI